MLKIKSKIYFYLLVVAIAGFLYVFLYQALASRDFAGIRFKAQLTDQTEEFYLLSGWVKDKKVECRVPYEVVWNEGRYSSMVVFMPPREVYKVTLEAFFPDYNLKDPLEVKIFSEDGLLIKLKPEQLNTWQSFSFFLSHDNIEDNAAKLRFLTIPEKPVAYKSIEMSNFESKKLIFPKGYTLWQKATWFSKKSNQPINWSICFAGMFILPLVCFIYSWLFKQVAVINLEKIIRLNMISVLPPLAIFLALYLISRLLYEYAIFYFHSDFWLIVGVLVLGAQLYYLLRYVNFPSIANKIKRQIQDIQFYSKFLGNIFAAGFLILFSGCIVPLILKQEKIAEELGNWAYLFLIFGVFLKFIEFLTNKEQK